MAHIESMQRRDIPRSGPALGGIGAGSIELRKDGTFRNWTIFNNEPLFGGPPVHLQEDQTLFFYVRWEEAGKAPQMRVLQIEADGPHPNGLQLQFYTFRWMRGVDETVMTTRWPFSTIEFKDAAMPFALEMEAFSPFIPHNAKDSALPGAFFQFKITPQTRKKVDVLLVANLQHMAGIQHKAAYGSKEIKARGHTGFVFFPKNLEKDDSSNGELCLLSVDPKNVTKHMGWSHRHHLEPYLHAKELSGKNHVDEQNGKDAQGKSFGEHNCFGSLGWRTRLSGSSKKPLHHTFALSWYFPNAYADLTKKEKLHGESREGLPREGHYYNNFFKGAAEVGDYLLSSQKRLEADTRAFTDTFYQTTLPDYVLNLVNAQLNTFFTSSWFTEAGHFGIQEGLTPEDNWGPLATVDVGMYGSIAAAALFPELDRAQWEIHRKIQFDTGDVGHGIARDFSKTDKDEGVKSRLDLAPQYTIQTIRNFLFTNDLKGLRDFWPSIRSAIRYTITQRDNDDDGLPEMSGSNSSYDNFPMFGPASYVASQFIAALQHALEAATLLHEEEDARFFENALSRARERFEEKLWNGRYFSLYNDEGGAKGDHDEGCMSDQIIGQWANHLTGMGDICSRKKINAALKFIVERNYNRGEGLYNCRWPEDQWLREVPENCWFDQANTFWTGVELAFVSFLAYEGKTRDALQLAKDVYERYASANRTWDHAEWGGHYYRPMSAWAILHGFLGYVCNGETLTFSPRLKETQQGFLFTHAGGYGFYERKATPGRETIRIRSVRGTFQLRELNLGITRKDWDKVTAKLGGKTAGDFERNDTQAEARLTFARKVRVSPKNELKIDFAKKTNFVEA